MFPKGFEWVVILIVALLIFGPKNLPKLGKSLGKTVKNIREGMSGDGEQQADEAEVDRQVAQLARDLEISPEVIREICEKQIAEYLELDAKRDASVPVHSIVEAYVGGTAFAWYGMNEYPRLRRVILRELAQGGAKAKRAFVLRASKAQVDLLEDF